MSKLFKTDRTVGKCAVSFWNLNYFTDEFLDACVYPRTTPIPALPEPEILKRRGRPKGSKNKPKVECTLHV